MATNVSEFKNLVAVDVMPCPDPIMNREVVSAILEFCQKTSVLLIDFEIDISDETPATPQDSVDVDVSTYTSGVRPCSIHEIMVDSVRYTPRARNILTDVTYFTSQNSLDTWKFFHIVDEDTVRVFDMSSDDGVIWFNMAVKPLRTATSVDDVLFEDHSEAIVAGAKWKLLSMPGKEWTDLENALIYRQKFKKYMSAAKARVLKGGSGGYGESVEYKSFGEID